MRTSRLISLALLLGACRTAASPSAESTRIKTESNIARTEIEAAMATLDRRLNAGQLDSAATGLADDYVWLFANQPADSGHANWKRTFARVLASATFVHNVTIDAVVASGPIAVARGRYVTTVTPRAAALRGAGTFADTGKVLFHLRKVDGRWLLAVSSVNSDRRAGR